MSTTTTETSAYLPSVWKNAYRYDDISANSIVFKSSASSFGSIAAPAFGTDDAKPKVLQIAKGTADGTIAYQWVDPAAASLGNLENTGAVVSSGDGTIYDVEGMNNSNYWGVALKYSADNKYVAQPLTSIAGLTAANTTADANYYLSYTATTSTWASVVLPTDTSVVKGGSYVEATASNLFSLAAAPAQNQMLVLTTTGYAAANLPTEQGEYHLVLSAANALPTFVKNSNNDAGGNFVTATALSDFTNVAKYNADNAAADTAIFNAITVSSGYNYMLNVNMDVYVNDITKLVGSDSNVTAQQLIAKLPEIVVRIGTTEIGRYTVKTNQPLQTISMSKVIAGNSIGANTISVSVNYATDGGVPSGTVPDDFIQIAKKNSVFGTYQSCGPVPSSP